MDFTFFQASSASARTPSPKRKRHRATHHNSLWNIYHNFEHQIYRFIHSAQCIISTLYVQQTAGDDDDDDDDDGSRKKKYEIMIECVFLCICSSATARCLLASTTITKLIPNMCTQIFARRIHAKSAVCVCTVYTMILAHIGNFIGFFLRAGRYPDFPSLRKHVRFVHMLLSTEWLMLCALCAVCVWSFFCFAHISLLFIV